MPESTTATNENWKSTACMLCSIGCALEVQTDGQHITKIRGDKGSNSSEGYVCQKAGRLDYYQNHTERLTKPLRKNSNGEFEEVEWDEIIPEIAAKMNAIKKQHGGHAFAYYGGGGQGNHLGGTYGAALRAALGTQYLYTALGQEKTGDFWVNGKLFGKQSCYVTEAMHDTDYVIVLGANPWAAHGVQRTRQVLKSFKKSPNRTMVVIDPRLTQTAKMADIHLAVKPGKDAFLLSAMIAIILQKGLENKEFIEKHTHGFNEVRDRFLNLPVNEFAQESGVSIELIEEVAVGFASAKTATVQADLGIQQSLHSTLNSYLEKLLFLITGNFNKKGGNHLITQFAPIIGHSTEDSIVTRVTGMKGISKIFPPNILPLEIDTDHPERVRAVIVDSGNPVLSAANTHAYKRAFDKLELSVTIDVAMTETARASDYVLPASTQFEKSECVFFTFDFPTTHFHLRKPVIEPSGDTLPEPDIYKKLLVAMGEIPERFPVLELIAKFDRKLPFLRTFPTALALTLMINKQWRRYVPTILYSTLGKALPENVQAAAVLWGVTQIYAGKNHHALTRQGYGKKGYTQGYALFNAILNSDKPVPIATFNYDDTWRWIKYEDKKVQLYIEELMPELDNLSTEMATTKQHSHDFPYILMAGERRSYNANQIFRTPDWRKTDKEGAMRIHPEDIEKSGFIDGQEVICESETSKIKVKLMSDDTVQPGMLTLPHGYGMLYKNEDGELMQDGPAINELTSSDYCDPIAKTPYHKHVPVRLMEVVTV